MEVNRAKGVATILENRFNEIQVTPFLNPTTVAYLDSLNREHERTKHDCHKSCYRYWKR